ncbi:MAG: glycosyltransferase family 4 protein [Acidobacteriota bacterium]
MNPSARPKVAFVIHRYGADLGGGIEVHCKSVAERMVSHWDLEVLTTRAHDYLTWADSFPEGRDIVDGVPVRRFSVDSTRDPETFAHHTDRILDPDRAPGLEEQRDWMKAQGPFSSDLLSFLDANLQRFDLIVFFSYLYATSYFGMEIARERAALVPAVHDEPVLHLPLYAEEFRKSRYILFSTIEEKRLVTERFGPPAQCAVCGGIGIDPPPLPPKRPVWPRPYLLYLGRVDHMKGCGELLSFFQYPPPWLPPVDLLLVGRINMDLPENPRIHALGYVDEERKKALIRNALALVVPSPFESLSIVLLEAWSYAVPAIVNAACPVLRGQGARSQAALPYLDVESFAEVVRMLVRSPAQRVRLGLRGLKHVRSSYRWNRVEDAYRLALRAISRESTKPGKPGPAAGTEERPS